jgi:ATP-dependent DNA ligase
VLMPYVPMVPTLVPKPFHRNGWVYEEKIDGYRMLAYKDGAGVPAHQQKRYRSYGALS